MPSCRPWNSSSIACATRFPEARHLMRVRREVPPRGKGSRGGRRLRIGSRTAGLILLALTAGCAGGESNDWPEALLEPRVPRAAAGDPSWIYVQRASADLDDDGTEETAVLICDVMLDRNAAPLWEDGQRWQVYVEEPDGTRTYLYAKFLPNGTLTADIVSGSGGPPAIVLLEHTPERIGVYELRYDGPNRVTGVEQLERAIDPRATFQGSPRP